MSKEGARAMARPPKTFAFIFRITWPRCAFTAILLMRASRIR